MSAKHETDFYAWTHEQAALLREGKLDAAVSRWLRDEVAPVYDAMKADPARAIPAEEVFAEVRGRHAGRKPAEIIANP